MTEREKIVWLNAAAPLAELAHRRSVTCGPEIQTQEIAQMLSRAHAGAVVAVSPDRVPLGLITSAELCEHVASGNSTTGAPATALMNRQFRTALPGLRPANYLIEMMRGRCRLLAITEDGTAASPLRGVVTDTDLTLDCGRNPTVLVIETLEAETVADLSHLRARTELFLTEGLAGPSAVDWCSQMLAEVNDVLVESSA
jgi:signal-transduction protein with cAMP-binding, CBS, and nucleotidyltransferase domain